MSQGDPAQGQSSRGGSTTAEQLTELEELQIHSIYSLIETIRLEVDGAKEVRKLLYILRGRYMSYESFNVRLCLGPCMTDLFPGAGI